MELAMLIYLVHSTFFKKFAKEWQVTDWMVAGKDQISVWLFRRGLITEVFHPNAETPSCSEIFTSFVIVDKISSRQSFSSSVGRASSLHNFVFMLRMVFLTSN